MISNKKNNLSLLFFLGIILCLSGCDERKASPVGGAVIDREDLGQFDEVPAQMALRDSAYRADVSLLTSPYLLIGDWNGYETKSLLRFGDFPDSVRIKSAELWLVTSGVIDTQVSPLFVADSFPLVISTLNTEWTGESISVDSIPEATPIGTVVVARTDDDTVKFSFPTDTVQAWIDGTASHNGLLLTCEEHAGFIKIFYSNNTQSAPPRLRLTWSVIDTTDTTGTDSTVAMTPFSDVFAVRRTTDWPFDTKPNQLMVANGTGHRSLLYFDIGDTIPPEATVIRAPLTLYIDQDYVFFEGMSIGVYSLTDSSWADPQFDENQITWTAVEADDDSAVFEIHTAVQNWIHGTTANYGLLIRSLYEHFGITSFVFHSSEDDIAALRPKLEVWYATPPDFSPKKIEKEARREE